MADTNNISNTNQPSIPPNYVTILQLEERWIKEQQRKKKEEEEEELKLRLEREKKLNSQRLINEPMRSNDRGDRSANGSGVIEPGGRNHWRRNRVKPEQQQGLARMERRNGKKSTLRKGEVEKRENGLEMKREISDMAVVEAEEQGLAVKVKEENATAACGRWEKSDRRRELKPKRHTLEEEVFKHQVNDQPVKTGRENNPMRRDIRAENLSWRQITEEELMQAKANAPPSKNSKKIASPRVNLEKREILEFRPKMEAVSNKGAAAEANSPPPKSGMVKSQAKRDRRKKKRLNEGMLKRQIPKVEEVPVAESNTLQTRERERDKGEIRSEFRPRRDNILEDVAGIEANPPPQGTGKETTPARKERKHGEMQIEVRAKGEVAEKEKPLGVVDMTVPAMEVNVANNEAKLKNLSISTPHNRSNPRFDRYQSRNNWYKADYRRFSRYGDRNNWNDQKVWVKRGEDTNGNATGSLACTTMN